MRSLLVAFVILVGCGATTSVESSDASLIDASTSGDAAGETSDSGPNACLSAGGSCGCAGGCSAGRTHGTIAQDNACPQPCPTCGACSEWCCVPDRSDAALDTAGITCSDASTFPSFDKSCGGDGDCDFGLHQSDCCGSLRAVGFRRALAADFAAAEKAWSSSCPACECLAKPTVADDGKTGSSFGTRCTAGTCSTYAK